MESTVQMLHKYVKNGKHDPILGFSSIQTFIIIAVIKMFKLSKSVHQICCSMIQMSDKWGPHLMNSHKHGDDDNKFKNMYLSQAPEKTDEYR